MLLQFRQYLRICSAGESVDLVDDPLEQVFDNRRGPLQERVLRSRAPRLVPLEHRRHVRAPDFSLRATQYCAVYTIHVAEFQ